MTANVLYRCIECKEIHNILPKDTTGWRPPMFFLIIYSYINIGFNCALWNSLWRKQNSLRDICMLLLENKSIMNRYSSHRILDKILNNIAYIFWVIIFGMLGVVIFSQDGYETFTSWLKAKFTLLDYFRIIFNSNPPVDSKLSKLDALYDILVVFCFMVRFMVGFFEEFFITIIILAAWIKISCVLYSLSGNKSWEFIKHNYSAIKRMVDTTNLVIQNNLFFHTAVVLFSYTFQFSFQFGAQKYFMKKSTIHQFRFVLFLTNCTSMYYLAADISHKVTVKNKFMTSDN